MLQIYGAIQIKATFMIIIQLFNSRESFFPVGGTGADRGDDTSSLLHRHAHWDAPPCHVGGDRWYWQDGTDERQTPESARHLHDRQRTVQLLHDVDDVTRRARETTREEGGEKLRSARHQDTHLLHRWHEYAWGWSFFLFLVLRFKALLGSLYVTYGPPFLSIVYVPRVNF